MRALVAAEIPNYSACRLANAWQNGEVIIDFTAAAAVPQTLSAAVSNKTPYVCCTTGIAMAPLQDAAKHIPVLFASNTSLSLAVTKKAAALIAQLLAPFNYAAHIHEEHHAHKKDAPSGTALALGAVIGDPVEYSFVRAGDIVGEHMVIFAGTSETIRLNHSVTDRRVFARGAIQAALWLKGRAPGLYGMEDVLAF